MRPLGRRGDCKSSQQGSEPGWGFSQAPGEAHSLLLFVDLSRAQRPSRGEGAAALAGALGGHRDSEWAIRKFPPTPSQTHRLPSSLGARAGGWGALPLPRSQVSAANMYMLVGFILIFGCFPFTSFLYPNTLSPWPQLGKPRTPDKRPLVSRLIFVRGITCLEIAPLDRMPGS